MEIPVITVNPVITIDAIMNTILDKSILANSLRLSRSIRLFDL